MVDSFENLFIKNISIVNKICFIYADKEEDRRDLFQEIALHAFKGFISYRGDAKFSTWLYRIALNVAITEVKKTTRIRLIKKPDPSFCVFNDDREDYLNARLENERMLYKAIKELDDIERSIVMFYLDDISYKEMEEILGIKEGSLRTRMNRIKHKLKNILLCQKK